MKLWKWLGDQEEEIRLLGELNQSCQRMLQFHTLLVEFLIDLRGLNNPEVDALFEKHQVELKET
ncbi:hypothetical protein KAT51_08435 [bacterium]|nr:hypothetical protein [bacterium]